jgi:Na+/proline symporter
VDHSATATSLAPLLAVTLIAYLVAVFWLSFAVRGRVQDNEDFLVAGRRLPLSLAWATLLATWFGAGTVLTAADEVREGGLQRAALDPFGAGLCLLIAGLLFAGPLWRMGLLTVSDFFRRRFGPRAELLSALVLVPSYFGWIAAQLVALAGLLELIFGLDPAAGILISAGVAMGYTLLGGMWSVTLTDAIQIALVLGGLAVLAVLVVAELGGGSPAAGLARLAAETPAEFLLPVPVGSAAEIVGWLGILAVGALGNLPGQDLLQRVFASRSAAVARGACLVAGGLYLSFGLLPVLMGLSARLLVPDGVEQSILPALAGMFLAPVPAVIFVLALVSAVLSTLDSAILAPSGVLAQNVLPRWSRAPALALNRWSVVGVTAASVAMAFAGEDAYSLLEDAYELPLVGLFVPLALGLYRPPGREAPALAAMAVGTGLWVLHYALGWESFFQPWLPWPVPGSLAITACSLAAYLGAGGWRRDDGGAARA